MRSAGRTLFLFVPGAAVVAAAFLWTSYMAHGTWRPAYAHRSDGAVLAWLDDASGASTESVRESLDQGTVPATLAGTISTARNDLPPGWDATARVEPGQWPHEPAERWLVYFQSRHRPVVIALPTGSSTFEVRERGNWYEYPGSYWRDDNENKSVVDRGEPNRLVYFFHMMAGHHGVFLLTPLWLLAIPGSVMLVRNRGYRMFLPALGILGITVVVIAFYVLRPLEDRNYGGVCSTPRWLLWLSPLWLTAMIPLLDAMASRWWARALGLALLAASIASAFFPWTNPWVQPWTWQWFGPG
jgi:hypothetical protein